MFLGGNHKVIAAFFALILFAFKLRVSFLKWLFAAFGQSLKAERRAAQKKMREKS
jgi:hypothetical protein